ncbi:COG3440 Predicted restriction endonuclease [Methylophilaceae bacterium]
MSTFQKIKIEDEEYFIIDSIQDLRAEDSFIHNRNKLEMFVGKGEARKYVGSYTGEDGQGLSDFFEYSKWGDVEVDGVRTYPVIQERNCFFSKSNLLKYLEDSRIEYQKKEQVYKNNITEYYQKNLESVNTLPDEMLFFTIEDVSDLLENRLNRAYIRSEDSIWKLWRKLILPKISYLSILKLKAVNAQTDSEKPFFYFRVMLDYSFRSIVHAKTSVQALDEVVDERAKRYRKGQAKYRKEVIYHMGQCPFTRISDERLLIASHIKPYQVCIDEDRLDQALDYQNGLALSPTYDRLFDQGYITFSDEGFLICGTLLSPFTWERLNIDPTAKNKMRIYPEDRKEYLDYHRKVVFLDNINDLV